MDIEELHKKTYIAPRVLEALRNEDFKRLGSRARALGFVKIIERELGMQLDELRQKIEQYYGDALDYNSAFVVQESKSGGSKIFLKLFLALLLLVAAGYIYLDKIAPRFTPPPAVTAEPNTTDNTTEQSREPNLTQESLAAAQETNTTQENNDSEQTLSESNASQTTASTEANETNTSLEDEANTSSEENTTTIDSELVRPSIAIVPKKRLWLGIIYLDDYKRKVYNTAKPIELNTSRDQLIVAGHTRFRIVEDGQEQNISGKRYFIYRAGELEPIDKKRFKLYNKGRLW